MYVWIWRHLPGPIVAKLAQALLLVALVSGLLLGLLAAGPVLHLSLSRGHTTEPGYAGTDPGVPATGITTSEIVGHPEQFLGRTVTLVGEVDRVLGLGDD
jgi:hypothetical protein